MRISNFIVILFFFLAKTTGPIHAQEKPLPLLHSHNDYEQDRPLINAIDSQFDSVEADIWWSNGEVKVSHLGFLFTGTLEELYLRPLFERVKSLGSVYGNSKTFYLWLDFKENNQKLKRELGILLKQYLPLFKKSHGTPPVQIILTGDLEAKKTFVQEYSELPLEMDEEEFSKNLKNKGFFTWYSIDWRVISGKDQLRNWVQKIHQQGKKVRFYGTPETPSFWRQAMQAEVDMIGTDEVQKLRDFINKKENHSNLGIQKRKPEWLRTLDTFQPIFQGSYSALLFRN